MRNSRRLLGLALLAANAGASAAEWTPEIELGVVRTDNLTLASTNPESATVWQLRPSIGVSQMSRRVTANAVYQVEAYRYDQRSSTEVYNQFDGNVGVAIVPERFFFDFGGSRTQAIVDPGAVIPVSTLVISGNRADLDEIYAGPSFNFPMGGEAVLAGQIRRTRGRYDDPPTVGFAEDYDYDTAEIGVDNYRRGTGFTWAARYSGERSDYGEQFLPYERREASIELGMWASEGTRVFALGGKESSWDTPLDPDLQDSFWEVGFARTSLDKLSAEFAYGERTFGRSRRARLTYDFGRGYTELSYAELPTTNAGGRYARGGLLNPDEPLDYLFRAGVAERYIQNRFQWQIGFEWNRADLDLTVFDETRDEHMALDGAPLPEEDQSGATLAFVYRFGRRLDLTAVTSSAERHLGPLGSSDLQFGSLAANYRLGSRTLVTVKYDRWKEESLTTGGLNYRAELLSAIVQRTLGRRTRQP